ncbi:MAG: hypothetical protein K6G82_03330 [Ruminococcus sp.]|nr:hypothetical protein [Ruminococcus sp.]
MKYFFKKSKAISLVLAAAMVSSFAAESADSTLYSPLKTTAAGDIDLTGTTNPPQSEIGGSVLSDVFGETTFYRWEKVTKKNYPKDPNEHLSLFFCGNKNQYALCLNAPDCIYMGSTADYLEGVSNKIQNSDGWSQFKGHSYVDESDSYFLRIMDKGRSNPSFYPDQNFFFTSDDCNALYTKYTGMDGSNPQYQIFMKGSNGLNYYIEPDESSNEGMLDLETSPNGLRKWNFACWDGSDTQERNGKKAPLWNLYHDDGTWGDDEHLINENGWLAVGDDERRKNDFMAWFIGTPYSFSTIKSDVTVRENQILAIGAEEYVDTSGAVKDSNGCIIPNGRTITIEKGGILSVSGQLINNGTIINNGGVILIRDGGTIGPFIQGSNVGLNGCGSLKCNNGDIIIQEGGALYAGMADAHCQQCPFYLDGNSTLINMGLLVYGAMKLGDYANVELYETSRTYGSLFNYNNGGMGSYYLYKRDSNGSISDTQYATVSELKNNTDKNFSYLAKFGYTMREYWICQPQTQEGKDVFGNYMAYMIWAKNTTIPASDLPSGWNNYFLENNMSKVEDFRTQQYTFLDSDIYEAAKNCSFLNLNGVNVKNIEHVLYNYSGMYVPYDQLKMFNGVVNVSNDTKVNVRKSNGSEADYNFSKNDSVLWDPTYATHMYYGYNQWKYKDLIL